MEILMHQHHLLKWREIIHEDLCLQAVKQFDGIPRRTLKEWASRSMLQGSLRGELRSC